MKAELLQANRVWLLTPENEVAFKQIWGCILKYLGYDLNVSLEDLEHGTNLVNSKSEVQLNGMSNEEVATKKDKRSKKGEELGRSAGETVEWLRGVEACDLPPAYTTEYTRCLCMRLQGLNSGEKEPVPRIQNGNAPGKHQHKTLVRQHHEMGKSKPEEIHQSIYRALRNDIIDNSLLRFCRARRFNVHDTLEMFFKAMNWRQHQYPLDTYIYDGDTEVYFEGKHPEFIEEFKLNQVYIRGQDKFGYPVVVIRVKEHFRHNCPDADFERFICLIIENTRLCTKDFQRGTDSASILFDMTGFTLKNADLAAIKFLITALEANYPECLGSVCVHNAPWVFNTVWKLIKGWVNPDITKKIHFTNSIKDLEKFIPVENIPARLGGKDDFTPKYIVGTHEDSDKKQKDSRYDTLIKERGETFMMFVEATIKWIDAKTPEQSKQYLEHKIKLGILSAQNYIQLDPYLRSRGVFDRNGAIGPIGY